MSETKTPDPATTITDPETDFRHPPAWLAPFVTLMAVGLSGFHFYTAGFGVLSETLHRATHLSVSMALLFLLFGRPRYRHIWTGWILAAFFIASYSLIAWSTFAATDLTFSQPVSLAFWGAVVLIFIRAVPGRRTEDSSGSRSIPFLDYVLAGLGAGFSLYLIINFQEIFVTRVAQPIDIDFLWGALAIILVTEGARRALGPSLPVIGILFLLYAVAGPYLPDTLAHRGFSITRIINHLYLGTEGIYGVALGVIATFVFHFVLFGVVAQASGLGNVFIGLATAAAGRFSGGPAKVSIVASSMFGMISGSTVANTVTTGSLTIPLMKRVGFRSRFAGAVEASASAGGQITPPIMGAAAFVMAETLGIPYVQVILIAALPAAMHYLSVLVSVHLEAKRLGLGGLPKEEIPRARDIFASGWHLLVPPVVMIALLLMRYTPFLAAFWGIVLVVVMSYFPLISRLLGKSTTSGTILTTPKLIDAFETGAKFTLGITATCACVGFILGTVTLTGIGFKLSAAVLTVATTLGGIVDALDVFNIVDERSFILFFALVFTALACILMGCGIPTVPLYIILSAIVAPALYDFGVPLLATHFAVFYFGLLSDLTPPLALAAFAAAGLAKSDPMATAAIGFRLSIAKLLVPFMFVYTPGLLFIGFEPIEFTVALISGILSITFLAAGSIGYVTAQLGRLSRTVLLLSGICLIFGSPLALALFGVAGIAAIVVPSWKKQEDYENSATSLSNERSLK